MDAFSEDQLAQVRRQRQAAGLQTFFQRGALVLVQPDMQIVLILPHGAPFSARRRHIGDRVLPASCVLVPKRYACALAARRREPDAPLFSGAREERDFNFLFLIDAFALLRPFKSVFEWRSRYISRYGIPKDWFLPFVVATIVATQRSVPSPAAFWQDPRTHP